MYNVSPLVLSSAYSDHQPIGQATACTLGLLCLPRSSPLLGTLFQVLGPFAQERGFAAGIQEFTVVLAGMPSASRRCQWSVCGNDLVPTSVQ